jgi:coenzyme F420-0:L-glutamate ligase / coenzyme F420-1:gamma-L-glutamate ligase
MSGEQAQVVLIAVPGIASIKPNDDLAGSILAAASAAQIRFQNGDVVVIAQKVVSKAENRIVALASVTPSTRAKELAEVVRKDARLVELILNESEEVVRARADVLIVRHRLGFVLANAGIDASNVDETGDGELVLLLPRDPDASAERIRGRIRESAGVEAGVIINDSIGRAWRLGTVGTAIGVAGIPAVSDLQGTADLFGRPLRTTQVGTADEIAAAASMLQGQAAEGRPVVIVRGLSLRRSAGTARDLVRARTLDLFT